MQIIESHESSRCNNIAISLSLKGSSFQLFSKRSPKATKLCKTFPYQLIREWRTLNFAKPQLDSFVRSSDLGFRFHFNKERDWRGGVRKTDCRRSHSTAHQPALLGNV